MTDTPTETDSTDDDIDRTDASLAPGEQGDATTEEPAPVPDGAGATGSPTDETVGSGESGTGSAGNRLVTLVQWAAFAILSLLALVSTFRFYFAVSEAIRVWFTPDFVPIFQAAFSLVVLLASAIGISILVRRLQ